MPFLRSVAVKVSKQSANLSTIDRAQTVFHEHNRAQRNAKCALEHFNLRSVALREKQLQYDHKRNRVQNKRKLFGKKCSGAQKFARYTNVE